MFSFGLSPSLLSISGGITTPCYITQDRTSRGSRLIYGDRTPNAQGLAPLFPGSSIRPLRDELARSGSRNTDTEPPAFVIEYKPVLFPRRYVQASQISIGEPRHADPVRTFENG